MIDGSEEERQSFKAPLGVTVGNPEAANEGLALHLTPGAKSQPFRPPKPKRAGSPPPEGPQREVPSAAVLRRKQVAQAALVTVEQAEATAQDAALKAQELREEAESKMREVEKLSGQAFPLSPPALARCLALPAMPVSSLQLVPSVRFDMGRPALVPGATSLACSIRPCGGPRKKTRNGITTTRPASTWSVEVVSFTPALMGRTGGRWGMSFATL